MGKLFNVASATCLLASGFLVSAPASAAVRFNFASVDAESYLMLANNLYSKDSYKNDNKTTYKTAWSAVTTAALTTAIGTASASASTTATFTSVSAATVKFTPQQAAINVNDALARESFAYATGSFRYDFTTDGKYTLNYTHSLATTGRQSDGSAFGQTFTIESAGTPLYSFDLFNGTNAGSVVLDAGMYTIQVYSNGLNWSDYVNGVGTNATSLNATFGFNLQQGVVQPPVVPEPASWAMLVGGFGLVGSAMRRRPRVGRHSA